MNEQIIIRPPAPEALNEIANIVGEKGVITGDDQTPFLVEWRGRWPGAAAMIVAPKSTEEAAAIVKVCAKNNIAITPQGGNTGLVGGQIPTGPEILISMKRMARIRDVSPLDNTMTVDAGVTLQAAQDAALAAERLFPLSIGSEGTCQVGGVISTNAGGVNVLKYGNTRELVLGLEVITPDGEIWDGLRRLRKNNTGYDLKQLFIGAEGTLGLVTGAVLKLFPMPLARSTAFVGLSSPHEAVSLLSLAQSGSGGAVTSFELISRQCMDLLMKHIPGVREPMAERFPWYVLLECSGNDGAALTNSVEGFLGRALEEGLASDAVIAANETQANDFWRMRHSISEAISGEGHGARHDVSVPTARIPAFLEDAAVHVEKIAPGARIAAFGHVGDGNVHYDVIGPEGSAKDSLDAKRSEIEAGVYDIIEKYDGSISAEHGVGVQRRDAIALR
ncbi:MAG: FAD-binding oxidoreductase, partial [Pseudomonadota bacterium]